VKSITNFRLEQEKFNKILGFARWAARDSKNWLISMNSGVIGFYPFVIRHAADCWILEKHGQKLEEFSSRSAALAYCAFYKKQQYELAWRTAELDQKLESLASELQSRKQHIKNARKRSQYWKLDLQLARYSQASAEYQKLALEFKRTIRDSKLFWLTKAKYNKF
jgi:hypothetical protein